MAYWSGNLTGNDYAVTQLGASLLSIKRRMFESTEGAINDLFPEQALVVHLRAIRVVIEQFPKAFLHVSFTVDDLQRAETLFHEWYSKVGKRIPAKYRAQIQEEAEAEFQAFRVLLGQRTRPSAK